MKSRKKEAKLVSDLSVEKHIDDLQSPATNTDLTQNAAKTNISVDGQEKLENQTLSTDSSADVNNKNQISSLDKSDEKSKKKKKEKKENKDTKKKGFKRFVPLIIVLIVGILSGSVLGYWYYKSSQIDDTIYDKYNEADLVDDTTAVLASVIGVGNVGEEELGNWVALAKAKVGSPKNLKASQNIALAQLSLSQAKSFEAYGVGRVETIADQTIYSVKKFDGETYTFESISKGTLTIADLSVYKEGNSVYVVKGTNIEPSSATWNGAVKSYTANEFKSLAGNLPSAVIPYIISSKTITSETEVTESVDSNTQKKLYTFSVTLNKITGAVNYCRQVKMTSGLDKRPLFDDITLTFTIDENWNFVRYEVEEHYSVFYIVKATCRGTLVTDFKINDTSITLPEYTL